MQKDPQARFRNTRSKFYKSKAPEDDPDNSLDSRYHKHSGSSEEKTGNYWKEKGNDAFKNGDFAQAIKHYSKAIQMNSSESVYFSNRARCHMIMKHWDSALKDAQEAVELDEHNAKAHFICGTALGELARAKVDASKAKLALKRLTRALTLSRNQKKHSVQEQVELTIFRMKKLVWYINYHIEEGYRKQACELMAASPKSEHLVSHFSRSTKPTFTIPDYLLCKITMDMMENPVMTEAGITYQKQAIEDHFSRNNNHKDPFTNQPVSTKLIPNLSIKQASQEFLDENPWAFQYVAGQRLENLRL